MKSIALKEIQSFFGSTIGYLVMTVFLLGNGLFLWIFEGDYNILDSGFADLSPFFNLAPIVLIFLIPAVTMRSFSEEKKQGTLELLVTKPLNIWQIVIGKLLGVFVLIVLAILPTFIYVWILYDLGDPIGNLDLGSIVGSYFGLLFLISSYAAIGIFASSLSENQIISFITAVFLCFFFYFGFEKTASIFPFFQDVITGFGMQHHFKSISRGVIDSRDVIYFFSVTILFVAFTTFNLKNNKL